MYKLAILINSFPQSGGEYLFSHLASDLTDGRYLFLISGDFIKFQEDNPGIQLLEINQIPPGTWYQNSYPDAPGTNPVEKYFNGANNVTDLNAPIWSNIISEFARNRELFSKLLTTTEPNAFSALQTAIQYRSMDLFKELALKVILGIPGGLSEEETDALNDILESNNFPNLAEMASV